MAFLWVDRHVHRSPDLRRTLYNSSYRNSSEAIWSNSSLKRPLASSRSANACACCQMKASCDPSGRSLSSGHRSGDVRELPAGRSPALVPHVPTANGSWSKGHRVMKRNQLWSDFCPTFAAGRRRRLRPAAAPQQHKRVFRTVFTKTGMFSSPDPWRRKGDDAGRGGVKHAIEQDAKTKR